MRSMALYVRPCRMACGALRKRLHSIGVSVSETSPDTRIAAPIVTANSCISRPTTPPMKSTGMNTAASDSVIEMMVNAISFDPSRAAWSRDLPISMCRTMFSSMTMASSTTNPTERVSAISERLSRLYPSWYITANVPTIEKGRARLGMIVADTLRRKRKITRTTRHTVRSSVNFTSSTDSRIGCARSLRTPSWTDAGSCCARSGSSALMRSTTSTVLVPGCRWIAR